MVFLGKHMASASQQRLMRKFFLPRQSQPEEKSQPNIALMVLKKSMATTLARFVSSWFVSVVALMYCVCSMDTKAYICACRLVRASTRL